MNVDEDSDQNNRHLAISVQHGHISRFNTNKMLHICD